MPYLFLGTHLESMSHYAKTPNEDKHDPLFCEAADVMAITEKVQLWHSLNLSLALSFVLRPLNDPRNKPFIDYSSYRPWQWHMAPPLSLWQRGKHKLTVMYVLHMSDELQTNMMNEVTSIMQKLTAASIDACLLCFSRTYKKIRHIYLSFLNFLYFSDKWKHLGICAFLV